MSFLPRRVITRQGVIGIRGATPRCVNKNDFKLKFIESLAFKLQSGGKPSTLVIARGTRRAEALS